MPHFDKPPSQKVETESEKREWMESVIGYLSPDERLEFVERQGGVVQGEFCTSRSQNVFAVKLRGVFHRNESNAYALDLYEGDLRDEDFPVELKTHILHREQEICEIMGRLRDEQARSRDECIERYSGFLDEVQRALAAYPESPSWIKRFGISAARLFIKRQGSQRGQDQEKRVDERVLGEAYLKKMEDYKQTLEGLKLDMGEISNEYYRISNHVFDCVFRNVPISRSAVEYRITEMRTKALCELTERIEELRKRLDLPMVPDPQERKGSYRD